MSIVSRRPDFNHGANLRIPETSNELKRLCFLGGNNSPVPHTIPVKNKNPVSKLETGF